MLFLLKSEGLFFFQLYSGNPELEMNRKDSLQSKSDTSVKRRSIFSKAMRQCSNLTDFIIGDKSRCVFSTKTTPWPQILNSQHSVHPKVIKLIWLAFLLL